TAHVRPFIELGFDFVAGIAGAPSRFGTQISGQRVAPLNHESLDDAVKGRAVIKPFGGKLFEILDGFGSNIGPEFDDHFARGGFDDCDFAHKILWPGFTWRCPWA